MKKCETYFSFTRTFSVPFLSVRIVLRSFRIYLFGMRRYRCAGLQFSLRERSGLFRILHIFTILVVPDVLYYVTVAILLLIYGGHHFSVLNKNPHCSHSYSSSGQSSPGSFLSNSSKPPQLVIHISDLHVNDIAYGSTKRHLHSFESHALPRWGPLAATIVVSGDLVHAIQRRPHPFGTRSLQSPDEWRWLDQYASRINQTLPWLATYGNHDSFGGFALHHPVVSNISSLLCPTPDFAVPHHRIQHHHFADSLHLILIDSTVSEPLHRPFNFFGDATLVSRQLQGTLDRLNTQFDRNSSMSMSNVLIVGHYPSATMASGSLIHSLAGSGKSLTRPRFSAYLSGHLHDIYGIAKRGLTAVSRSGSLELETPDMAFAGAYRIFAFDHSVLSFKTFSVQQDASDNFLQHAIILNLPEAGLCSPGAGATALASTHIRILSPGVDLDFYRTVVKIDGHPIGVLESFNHVCSDAALELQQRDLITCQHVYGVKWNSSLYKANVHTITLHSNDIASKPFRFSLDGSSPTFLHTKAYALMSAFFGLSDFHSILIQLSNISLLLCSACTYRGMRLRESLPTVLFSFAVLLWTGFPVIIARNLTYKDPGFGFVGLWQTSLPTTSFSSSVDVPFILSRQVFWTSFLQVCYIHAIRHSNLLNEASSWTILIALLSLRRCWSWCMEIAGAYGISAALLSPTCAPLLVLCLWSIKWSAHSR